MVVPRLPAGLPDYIFGLLFLPDTRRIRVGAHCESADYTERAFIAAIAAAIAIFWSCPQGAPKELLTWTK